MSFSTFGLNPVAWYSNLDLDMIEMDLCAQNEIPSPCGSKV